MMINMCIYKVYYYITRGSEAARTPGLIMINNHSTNAIIIIMFILIIIVIMMMMIDLHPVSITRFPLRRFSPGAGLLGNPFVS